MAESRSEIGRGWHVQRARATQGQRWRFGVPGPASFGCSSSRRETRLGSSKARLEPCIYKRSAVRSAGAREERNSVPWKRVLGSCSWGSRFIWLVPTPGRREHGTGSDAHSAAWRDTTRSGDLRSTAYLQTRMHLRALRKSRLHGSSRRKRSRGIPSKSLSRRFATTDRRFYFR
jgi:hypothetical protein